MKTQATRWTVKELRARYTQVDFPGYQREPNVWSRDAKQRLIDSMLREFDIASFYFYVNSDDSRDCVDGRQRIGAIMSFLGENPNDDDNAFEFRILNEVYRDEGHLFSALENLTFDEISRRDERECQEFVQRFLSYGLTVVELSKTHDSREFNLQFARLNLGTIINSGEKLHAMVGELRDLCFGEYGRQEFLRSVNVPTRRFSREQLAAQILAQVFTMERSKREKGVREFARTRHFDLQRLFKEYTRVPEDERAWIDKLNAIMARLSVAFGKRRVLRNRAIVVSVVLLAYEREIESEQEADSIAEFVEEFVRRLKWQIGKGWSADSEYRYLIDFQRNVTQASVERRAVEGRAAVLEEEYERWAREARLRGDGEYMEAHKGEDPREACRGGT